MKTGGVRSGARSRPATIAIIVPIVVICLAALSSCAKPDVHARFSESLARIDREIADGNGCAAAKSLVRLRKHATSSGNWLSIAKRERSLGDMRAAEKTLSEGLTRIPSSAELAAVMADTLILGGNVEKARDYASSLGSTAYAPLRSWLDITVTTRTDPFAVDGTSWKAAAEATGLPFFARNGVVACAMNGNLSLACETALANTLEMADEPLFRATLYYDAGFDERVLEMLSPEDPAITSFESLSLMADAAWSLGNSPVARALWFRIADSNSGTSSLALYDLAATAPDFADEKAGLETLLTVYPDFYPAVVRYVRNVPRTPDSPVFDAIESELDEAGFRSQDMERKLADRRVTRERARQVLDSALLYTKNAVNTRLLIEDVRLDWFTGGDSAKSTARVWNLLERYPNDRDLKAWAMWFFSAVGDVDTAIAINAGSDDGTGTFYEGLSRALAGDLDGAEDMFARCANDEANDWRALANIARIRERREDYPAAIESYSLAAGMADDAREASVLHYEAARLLAKQRSIARAVSILGYALELDPANYRADALLRSLEAAE